MSIKDDGGCAFPVWELNGHGQQEMTEFGMSLRDYFAAKAFGALIIDQQYRKNPSALADMIYPGEDNEETPYDIAELYAKYAYILADAMLEARKK